MVAERLLDFRSPSAFSSFLSPASNMEAAAASPGEAFMRPPMMDQETEVITVGGVIVKIGLAAGTVAMGASAMAEAKEVVVENLVKVFGKYQSTPTELSDIQQNTLDGTPDTTSSKLLYFDDSKDDNELRDPATASVIDKRTKIEEALAANTTKNKSDIEPKPEKVSTEGMLAIQEQKYTKFIAELFEQQQTNLKEEIQTMGEKYAQNVLAMETIIRQKDVQIEQLEMRLNEQMENKDVPETNGNKETEQQKTVDERHDPLFHSWPGKSPGPDVMQGKSNNQSKEATMHAIIHTPEKEWSELVEDTVNDWVGLIGKTGECAPDEYASMHVYVYVCIRACRRACVYARMCMHACMHVCM